MRKLMYIKLHIYVYTCSRDEIKKNFQTHLSQVLNFLRALEREAYFFSLVYTMVLLIVGIFYMFFIFQCVQNVDYVITHKMNWRYTWERKTFFYAYFTTQILTQFFSLDMYC